MLTKYLLFTDQVRVKRLSTLDKSKEVIYFPSWASFGNSNGETWRHIFGT